MELSRRTFSTLAGTAALGFALTGSGGVLPSRTGPRFVPTGPPPAPPVADGAVHTVGHDRYSLLVDGRRLTLWPGAMHLFRLPSPSLWRDVLEKMRAHGYNAVSLSVAWNYHSPAPGSYDFTGVRNLGLFLRMAAETGLYVVLRPGPYLGADVDAGGFPGWLTATEGRARTTDPAYLAHADEWLTRVNAIAARHLYTRGRGTVLLYQLEDTADTAYLSHLHRKVRADGIDVPLSVPESPLGGLRNDSMAYGGTSWGWLAAPQAPGTSYGSGAALDEGRRPTAALAPLHRLGHLLRTVPDFAKLDRAKEVRSPGGRLEVRHLANRDTDSQTYVVRNDSAEAVSTPLPGAGIEVPVNVRAHDTKVLSTRLRLGGRTLRYATAQLMLFVSAGRQDIAVFSGRYGDMAQVVLECPQEPTATRLDAEPAWIYDRGLLRVTCPLGVGELARVKVENGGSDRPLLLLFADDATALRLWPYETPSGSVLVYGPSLVRDVRLRDDTVHLSGDTAKLTGLEVWGPRGMEHVTWNGRPVSSRISATFSLLALKPLPGQGPVPLPALDGWRRRAENPESAPDFDDSAWVRADKKSSFSTTPVPEGQPVLFADDYGFHYGDVWYRGRVSDAEGVASVSLGYSTGTQGLLMAWLDGRPLGTHRMPAPDPASARQGTWTDTAAFDVPKKLRKRKEHVLSVLVRRMAHDVDEMSGDTHKAARGLTSATFKGASPVVSWRLQGAGTADPVRGPLNNGGLHGEREGWHLPAFDDRGWEAVDLPRAERRQGVTWYRTGFRLSVPAGVDASIGLTLDDDPKRAYRVQIFLNGWNMGQYVNDAGPRHPVVLPNGILRTRGSNSLALAVLSDGSTEAGPKDVRLTLLGASAGGVTVDNV
ncbi:beta-galactosidase [Streptomyces sp. Act143]|uniref:beta-galactosidase n=1 Tax=Streptomyces sp. Act143 TaxID=2200760 RepID=UPI000D675486|nr:beta-galactosidase [Streptomyces sp. Act143]PWI18601.1 beta-galactosidase [Streptomyces sp. Act143]